MSFGTENDLHGTLVRLCGAHVCASVEIDEERLAVGAETGPGKLNRIIDVPCKLEAFSTLGYASKELHSAVILARDNSSARTYTHVVRRVQHIHTGRFEDHRQRLDAWVINPDLAQSFIATIGRIEVNLPT